MLRLIFTPLLMLLLSSCGSFTDKNVHQVIQEPEISQETVRASVKDTLDLLNRVYVFPKVAKDVEKEIVKRMNAGDYDHIKTKGDFASIIGADLREVSNDGHLGIMLVVNQDIEPTHILVEEEDSKKYNYAFQKIEVMMGNVGYVKLNKFYQDEEARKTVDYAFGFLSKTDALIIDLRDCVGGSPQLVQYMISHFFEKPTILWTTQERDNKSSFDFVSIEGLGPNKFKYNYPIYILSSQNTASAAELFSYALKSYNKATIVGEKSMGVAHLVGAQRINQHFDGRFSMATQVNPISKTNWEG